MVVTRRGCLAALGAGIAAAAEPDLQAEWRRIAESCDGTLGAAALWLETGRQARLRGHERFPLLSICKLPIAMHMLALVDEGKMALEQPVEVLPRDVVANVSPIAARWPAQRRFPLREMIERMVAQSDNTAVETLFRIGGAAAAMRARLHGWGIQGVRVDRSERQCGLDRNGVKSYPPSEEWTDASVTALVAGTPAEIRYRATVASLRDPRDTGTPVGTVQLLARLFRGQALSASSTEVLTATLKSTTTFQRRLKGLLPPGTVVAHKTGSSGTIQGFAAATNDSGVIYLPSGGMLAVSVYLKGSTRPDAERDRVIAKIARAAYDAAA